MAFRIDAMEIQHEDFGQGPAVVVLHDRPSNRELRTTYFQTLADAGCRVVIANPAGLGTSPPPATASEDQSVRVLALFNYLGIGRAVLIGIGGGGQAALDLLERFPARVAGASFVVSAALAAELRRQAGSREALAALRRGHCGGLKRAFLSALPQSSAPPQLPRLRAWIHRLCEIRTGASRQTAKDCAALLAGFDLPALLVETDAAVADGAASAPSAGNRSLRPLQALSRPLQALLCALLPAADLFTEEADEDFSEVP